MIRFAVYAERSEVSVAQVAIAGISRRPSAQPLRDTYLRPGIHHFVVREQLSKILVDQAHATAIDNTQPEAVRSSVAEIDLAIQSVVFINGLVFHIRVVPAVALHCTD